MVAFIVGFGVFRSFTRGAQDFAVFYHAWRLVLEGHAQEIYLNSPDRFLYGPAFAWLFAPLALFSKPIALGLWCLAKSFVLGLIILKFTKFKKSSSPQLTVGLACWGVVLVARPLLIDFEYGQVNLFITGACVWAMVGHFETQQRKWVTVLSWFVLTLAAWVKLFPLPLLCIPWFVKRGIQKEKLLHEKWGIVLGCLTMFLLPFLSLHLPEVIQLFFDWKDALLARGLPLESHNQSFTALLFHYLSGSPTLVRSEGNVALLFGLSILSPDQIALLSLAWSLITVGFLLGWIQSGSNHAPLTWVAIAIGLLIVPSHLVWKPYFVLSIPAAILILQQSFGDLPGSNLILNRKWPVLLGTFLLFLAINLSGFDVLGHHLASHLEAGSILLILHLTMIGILLTAERRAEA